LTAVEALPRLANADAMRTGRVLVGGVLSMH